MSNVIRCEQWRTFNHTIFELGTQVTIASMKHILPRINLAADMQETTLMHQRIEPEQDLTTKSCEDGLRR